jgi:hypothetical protein
MNRGRMNAFAGLTSCPAGRYLYRGTCLDNSISSRPSWPGVDNTMTAAEWDAKIAADRAACLASGRPWREGTMTTPAGCAAGGDVPMVFANPNAQKNPCVNASGTLIQGCTFPVPTSTKATPADLARLDAVTSAICKECASMPAAGGNPSGADLCKLFQAIKAASKTVNNAPNWAKLDEMGARVPCVAAALKSVNLPTEISGSDKTLTYVAYGVGAVVGVWILYKLL